MPADWTLPLLTALSCCLVLATVIVYERLLKAARYAAEEAEAEAQMWADLAAEHMIRRHPSQRGDQ